MVLKKKGAKAAKAEPAMKPESEFHLDAVGEDVTMEDLFAPFPGMAKLEEEAPLVMAPSASAVVDEQAAAAEAQKLLPESEFHIGAVSEEVTYDDLLNPLQSSRGLGSLRKQLLKVSEREAVPEPASEVKRGREVREVQFQSTSKHLGRWGAQLREMARADQVVLGLDPQDPNQTTADLVGSFSAQDDFEKELEEATRVAGATEADLKAGGQMPMNPRIRDEQQTRHAARLKALILREKIASKRVGKIKSKAYRKIHRNSEKKEREVLLERLEHENPELAKTLRQEYEKKHAEMRLMRQRNARKKWAATMQRFAKNDQTAHQEISKQAQNQRDEELALRRAIKGRNPEEGDDSDVDLSADEDAEGTAAQRTIEKAKQLTLEEVKGLAAGTDDLPTTGVLGMNFMRQAIQRKREAAKGEAQEALKELQKLGKTLDEAHAEDSENEGSIDGEQQKLGEEAGKDELKAPAATKTFSAQELAEARAQVEEIMEKDGGPQFSVSGPVSVKGVAARESLPGSRKGTKRKAALAKSSKKKSSSKEQVAAVKNPFLQEEEEVVEAKAEPQGPPAAVESITGTAPASSSGQQSTGTKRRKAAKSQKITTEEEQEAPLGSAAAAAAASSSAGQSIFADLTEAEKEQRELVRTTFVEGTQEEDFQAEQDARLEDAAEKARKATEGLAGWGSWTGEGVAPRKSRAQQAAEAKAAKELASRGGEKKRHAVFQPYEGKGADKSKYYVDKVPYEFKNADYHDQQLKMPAGPEWQTLPNHINRIKPKFFAKVGAIVPPLQHVKDFEPHKQREIMNVWASSKQPRRMKARL